MAACSGRVLVMTGARLFSNATFRSGNSTPPAAAQLRSISIAAARRRGRAVEHLRLTDQISELALAPDGKKVAFIVRGEIFAASSTDGGDAARVTVSPAAESQVAWSMDSRRLVYVSDRDGPGHLFHL